MTGCIVSLMMTSWHRFAVNYFTGKNDCEILHFEPPWEKELFNICGSPAVQVDRLSCKSDGN